MQPPITPKKIKRATTKQRTSLNHPSGKKQAIIIKTMMALTNGMDNKQSVEIRSFIALNNSLNHNFDKFFDQYFFNFW